MHSVLENDTDTIDEGKLLNEAINQGVSSFMPEMMFENLVKNYSNAERIYGERLIRLLTGYDPGYVKKNIRIPEFARKLKSEISQNLKNMRKKGLLDAEGSITLTGIYLASLVLYTEELDNLLPKGYFGKKENRKRATYGDKQDLRRYRSHDRFKDIDLKKTVKNTIKRGRSSIIKDDLLVSDRISKGSIEIVYALDASGSMRGKKIETAKKAGIALAFMAIENRDKVGLIAFGSEIKEHVLPTLDFVSLLRSITEIRASNETNFISTIDKAIEMFSKKHITKHLILLTDAMPTVGDNPEKDTLNAIARASSLGITTSIVGVDLDKDGESFATKLIEVSQGRLYIVKSIESLDTIILEDYYSTRA